MKKMSFIFLVFIALGCKDFLDVSPQGELSESVFENSEEGVEGVIIGVYSMLNGQYNQITNAHRSGPSNWVYGDVVSDDAYKGSSGISDGSDVHQLEIFQGLPDNQGLLVKWEACYEGVSRANRAISIINNFTGWGLEQKNMRLGEVRVLRGHFYFELKKIFNRIPYIDENTSVEDLKRLGNRDLTSEEIWEKIEEDFNFSASHLPTVQEEVGRVTSVTANAYLTKTYLYQSKWQQANATADAVIKNLGNHFLLDNFEKVFFQNLNNQGAEFCPECLFEVQHSLDPSLPSSTSDVGATFGWDGNVGDRLSGLGGPYPRVYGFHKPSQDLVNAFKTDKYGLPLFNSMNNSNIQENDFVDPRLDHTIGRPGIPFFDAGIYDETWTRGVITYGPYAGKKQLYPLSANAVINIPYYTNSENYCIIRLSDLYLFKAESLIELNRLEEARNLVNLIRSRAKNGPYVLREDGSNAASYNIDVYVNPWTDQEFARESLRRERRLELAMEGHRFFDLVRWGIAKSTLNNYIKTEQNLRSYLNGSDFKSEKNEYFPIPASEIDISEGRFIQNNGY